MLVLVLSPVPMVRGFGVLLAVGVAIALVCALSAGAAAISLSLAGAGAPARARSRPSASSPLVLAWRGARELLADNPLTRRSPVRRWSALCATRGRVLCIGLALAVLGWGLDTQTSVQTDITKLVPQNLGSLQNLNTVERTTGVGGEIELMLEGKDLTRRSTIEWMVGYQKAVLARFGYAPAQGCQRARLCPAFSLPDLFQGQAAASSSTASAPKLSQAEINGLLSEVPSYFSPGRDRVQSACGDARVRHSPDEPRPASSA